MPDPPAQPRRRWTVHLQRYGEAKTMQSFEKLASARKCLSDVEHWGGNAMIEDRWVGRGESSKGVIPWKENP